MGATEAVVAVLAVSSAEDDFVSLGHVFSHSKWRLEWVRSCEEASRVLGLGEFPVIICAASLSDGTWKDLLALVQVQAVAPRVIVVSSIADDSLWGEVLDSGGYDVLGKPFDPGEVIRVVSLAWRQWKSDCERRTGEGAARN